MDQILSFTFRNEEFPILAITEKENQTVIRIIHQNAHYTLHLKDDGLLLTHWDSEYQTVHSKRRVEIARIEGYKNPEKHGNYLQHNRLIKSYNMEGYNIGARSFPLKKSSGDDKYLKKSINIGSSEIENPLIWIILSTPDNPFNGISLGKYKIQFGVLHFTLELNEKNIFKTN